MKRPDGLIDAMRADPGGVVSVFSALTLIAWIDHLERRSRDLCRYYHHGVCACGVARACLGPCDCDVYEEREP